MSEERTPTIEPVQAPLSHLKTSRTAASSIDRRTAFLGAGVLGLIIAIALLWPDPPEPAAQARTEQRNTTTTSVSQAVQRDETPAPFEASQRRLTRERAQQALSRFVELQIELEEQMSVAAWGQGELDAALALAKEGDIAFTQERYEESMARYEEAVEAIQGVRATGEARFESLVTDVRTALAERDTSAAGQHLSEARTIKPNAPEVTALGERLEKQPEVVALLRTAKNHQLAGRFDDALASYDAVAELDPDTNGLNELRSEVALAQRQQTVASHITNGFEALDNKRFDRARREFNAALALESGNQIALGGLAQVAKDNDLSVIERARQQGEAALSEERWEDAKSAYQRVLKLDRNIRFASQGLRTAESHEQSMKLLTAITGTPKRLSSQSLFLQAEDIVEKAQTLSYRGPKLNALLAETERLLGLYRDPVDVTLRSDNATDIVVSNIGRLGFFSEKVVSLRPGEYTIRGSQAGCRDLYLSVEVLPGIEPLDLSCPERLARE